MRLILFLFFIYSSLQAKEIVIKGNNRTKASYIKKIYARCVSLFEKEGKKEKKNQYIEQCIKNTKLFYQVKINNKKDKILISLKDRWTLIPIPLVKSERGQSEYGIFIFERNFLGLGQIAVLGGTKGTNTASFFTLYKNPYLFNTNYNIFLNYKWEDGQVFRYSGKNEIDGHQFKKNRLSLGIGKKFNYFITEFGVGINKISYSTVERYTYTPNNFNSYFLLMNLGFINSAYKLYFEEGFESRIRLQINYKQDNTNSPHHILFWRLKFQKNLLLNNAFQLELKYQQIINQKNGNILYLGSEKGTRGALSKSIWAKNLAALSIDYQIPISINSYGTWTLGPFSEMGYYKNFDESKKWNQTFGYGVGFYLYLKKIAIPGLGLVVGVNPKFEKFYTTFSVGGRND